MDMKKWGLVFGVLCIVGVIVALFKANAPLKTPTPQQLQAAFPNDTRKIFENSDKFVLLSIDPSWGYKGKNEFHGYRAVGQTQVSPEVKAKLIDALYDGMAAEHIFRAACFSPRHGIHAVKGNKYVDLLICFSCQQFLIYPSPLIHSHRGLPPQWRPLLHSTPRMENVSPLLRQPRRRRALVLAPR